jgi:hypothetical protein
MILWDSDADALLVDAADIFLGDSDLLVFGDAVGTGDIKIYATGTDLIIDGIIAETGTVSIGLTDLGLDFKLWAATSAEGVLWDASDEALEFTGANLTLDSASGINFPLEVVAATNVITTDEAGKIFVLSDATEFASTLPTASTAAGMVVTFIIADAPESADYTISTGNTHENIMYGMVLEADVDTGDDGPTAQAQDRCNFKDGVAVIGDYVILICDGTNWYVRGMTAADGGVTFDTQ